MRLTNIQRAVIAGVCCLLIAATRDVIAQTPSASSTDQISFDRPEAWAMKYFTSATTVSGLSTPNRLNPGALAIQFESGWLPTLSAAQERVGFNGTTPEDLNKSPVFFRPRVAVGLPHQLTIVGAFDPPIRSFGVTPLLWAVGVDGVVHDSRTWRFGWRAHGEIGTITAAVTCPANVLLFAQGSVNNPAGCTAESKDVTTLRYAGLELDAARHMGRRFVPHAAAGVNIVDDAFQTNAETFGAPDHTRLNASGLTVTTTAGIGYAVTERLTMAVDLFYAPLYVRRSAVAASSIDPMVNARALISYQVIR